MGTIKGELLRGLGLLAVTGGLAGIALFFRTSETDAGNRAFLLVLAVLLIALSVWGMIQTFATVQRMRRNRSVS